MNIPVTRYDTVTMMSMVNNPSRMAQPSTYWLDLCFPLQVNFETKYLEFDDLPSTREIAPLVVPYAKGVPMVRDAQRVSRIAPAYSKMQDPVSASRVLLKAAGTGELMGQTISPAQRYASKIETMLRTHRKGLTILNEVMAATAVIDGKITLTGEKYPTTDVDFGRDALHDVTLVGAAAWGQSGVSIVDSIEDIIATIQNAKQGGVVNRLTVGTDVWKVMRKDTELVDWLDKKWGPETQGGFTMDRGINTATIDGDTARKVGSFDSGAVEIWVYSGWYEKDGVSTQIMDPRDVVFTGTSVQGIRCYGPIHSIKANWAAAEVWSDMYPDPDGSAMYVQTQQAPIMVPMSPDATYRLRAIA